MAEAKQRRHRSPNFPVIKLESALDYLERLFKYANGKHLVPAMAAIEDAWGMKKGSAYGKQVVGAMKSFGLIEDVGAGIARKIKVSDAGAKIRGMHSDRPRLLREAALAPKLHAELWNQYGNDETLPPVASLRQYLVFDRIGKRFNEASVGEFIDEFIETVKFAKLCGSNGARTVDTPNNGDDPKGSHGEVRVGSFVQWTSNGQHQFPGPKPVVGIDGDWAFVEGSPTGLPMSELSVQEPPESEVANAVAPPNPHYKVPSPSEESNEAGFALERTTLDEGPVKLTWPDNLSEASVDEFEYWVKGLLRRARRKAGLPTNGKDD